MRKVEGRMATGTESVSWSGFPSPSHPYLCFDMSGQQIQSNIWVKEEIILSMQFTNKSNPRFPISPLTPLPHSISFRGIQKGKNLSPCPSLFCQFHCSIFFCNTDLWSANDSLFSALRVPAVANMIVVSRSAIIPDTALAAVIQACVPLFPAWRADKTKETYKQHKATRSSKESWFFESLLLSQL